MFLLFLKPLGKNVGTGPNDAVYDSPIGSRCPSGKDQGGQASPEVNSPIETSPISVAPSGMFLFFFLILVLATCLYRCVTCELHSCV